MEKAAKPNIILFMPDSLRADAVFGMNGKGKATTPNMDWLAEQGTAFDHAFAQHTVCSPSRISMFTGLYPHTNGHRTLTSLLRPDEYNLFRDFREAGYKTVCFGKNDLLAEQSTPLSFDSVTMTVKPEVPKHDYETMQQLPERLHKSFYGGKAPESPRQDPDWAAIESALAFLDQEHDQPFVLYMPLNYPHPPYYAEEPFFSLHDRTQVPLPIPADFEGKRRYMELIHRSYGLDRLSPEDFQEIKATYWGMVSRMDDALGKILRKVQEKNLEQDTAVFVFSDHGDYTGDYGLTEKWFSGLEDLLVRVPLIMKVPGYPAVGRRSCLVEMVDLYRTLLDVAHIECRHYQFGKSLLPLLVPETPDRNRDVVFAEGGHNAEELGIHDIRFRYPGIYYEKSALFDQDPIVISKSWMVRDNRYKYVYCPDDCDELYDIQADPDERRNLAPLAEMSETITGMKGKLLEWLTRTADHVSEYEDRRSWG